MEIFEYVYENKETKRNKTKNLLIAQFRSIKNNHL